MSLYDRFRGYDDDEKEVSKLPIWPTITSVAEILSGQLTDVEAIERFNLDATEIEEFSEVKSHISSEITSMETAFRVSGLNATTATTVSRAVVRNSVTQILMRAELGYCTRSEFNTSLGIS